jgi:hypothetical protein
MPTETRSLIRPDNAAAVLAAALLMALAWTGWTVVQQVRLVPSSVPPATVAASKTMHGDPAARQRATSLATGPRWSELNATQRRVLEPLEERWPMIGAVQKRRWMALAEGYDKLSEKEQEKLRSRMQAWSNLSAQQRSQARLNFALTNRIATDKQAQWEAYQALSDEEKRLLAARAAPKVTSAAPAIKPLPAKRLARIPAATATPNTVPNPPKIPPATIQHPPPPVPSTPAMVETHPVRPSGAIVETAPVDIPSATPMALPPLDSGGSRPPLSGDGNGAP